MRFVLVAFIVSVAPSALFAEAVESRAEMVSVTLFPQGAQVTRVSKSNARVEVARITVDNLTPRDWPVRLLDRVPYSEQDSLKVTWKADPAPSATDWQDRRGILSWVFDLPKGQKKEISLTTTISWPTGQVLQ